MDIDALLLSRIQFAWVISLHILLPALTIGLSCYVATLEILWWIRKDEVYRRLSAFWIRIFAVSFGLGVVSGIVMPFQFGTNWSRYIDITGSVVGGLMAYEVITAFFLEAAFLGVLLFGRDKVPQWAHVLSALMVALGTLLSSFWIIAVNSWMQTPQGFEVAPDGRFFPVDMLQVIFTPSFPYRLAHTLGAFVVTAAFVILAVGAGYLRQRRHVPEGRTMVRMALGFLAVMLPAQILLGDLHGLNTLQHQGAKLAAMEGLWETQRRVPASLFAIPDQHAEQNHYEIAVPALGSLYLTHSWDGEVKGLKEWPPDERPPVAIVYWAFRVMVGIGVLMLALVAWGCWLAWRGRAYDSPGFLRAAQAALPLGFVALLAGWTVTEVGRQPWAVYDRLRTVDAVTPSLTTADVAVSLVLYVAAYLVIFGGGLLMLRRMVREGPPQAVREPAQPDLAGAARSGAQRPMRPLSAARESVDAEMRTGPPTADQP